MVLIRETYILTAYTAKPIYKIPLFDEYVYLADLGCWHNF